MAATLLGCSNAPLILDPETEPGRLEQPIINGSLTSGHPAVGMLVAPLGGSVNICTATLVGSQTVLTAAHCVVKNSQPYSKLEFYINGQFKNSQLSGTKYEVASFDYHPSYTGAIVSAGPPDSDVAVVHLSKPVTGITPITVVTDATYEGESVTLVGYGKTGKNASDIGTKRMTKNTVKKIWSKYFGIMGATGSVGNMCQGDSGGPVFANRGGQDVVVGIISAGTCPIDDSDPSNIQGYIARADVYYSWIEQTANGDLVSVSKDTTPPQVTILKPAPDAQVPSSFSVLADVKDTSPIKEVKLVIDGKAEGTLSSPPYAFQVSGQAAGEHTIQVEAIDPTGNSGSASITVTVDPSKKASTMPFGSLCALDSDCDEGRCVIMSGKSYCSRHCSGAVDCPQGFDCTGAVCVESQSSGGSTPPQPQQPDSSIVGQPCDSGYQDCPGGFCVVDPENGSQFCTVACSLENDSCPGGMVCHPTDTDGTPVCGYQHEEHTADPTPDEILVTGACDIVPGGAPSGSCLALLLLVLCLGLCPRRRK